MSVRDTTPERTLGVEAFVRWQTIVTPESTLVIIITIARFSVESVTSATALQSYARVGTDRIVTALRLQTLVGVHLTLVDVDARVRNRIEIESNFTITPESSDFVRAHLITVAGILIGSTLINIHALIIMSPETGRTRFHLLPRLGWINLHHSNTLIRAFDVVAAVSFITGTILFAFVDVFTFAILRFVPCVTGNVRTYDINAYEASARITTNLIFRVTCGLTGLAFVHVFTLVRALIVLESYATAESVLPLDCFIIFVRNRSTGFVVVHQLEPGMTFAHVRTILHVLAHL